MSRSVDTKKLYIAKLTLGQWVDNVYLSGAATAAQAERFALCLEAAKEARGRLKDWAAYRAHMMSVFADYEFVPVRK